MTATINNFADILDPRFSEIFDADYTQAEDKVSQMYRMKDHKQYTERVSQTGTLPEMQAFNGSITYGDFAQGYDTTYTVLEFAQGFSVQRLAADFDQFDVLMDKPKALADSVSRLRNVHRVRPFVNAFSVDTFFYNNTEGVALCSNSHTTTSGASTAAGFDNYVTTALNAVSLASARNQMVKHRNDQAQEISVMPDELFIPTDLYETAYEIVGSAGKVDTANNNANVHYGQYKVIEDLWFSTRGDTNNWFLMDSKLRQRWGLIWSDHIKGEFGMVEEFDTLIGKWRVYCVWSMAVPDWRWITGSEVS